MDDFYITFPAGDDDEAEEEKDAPEDGRDEQPPVTWPLDWQHGGGADTHSSGAYRLQQTFPFFSVSPYPNAAEEPDFAYGVRRWIIWHWFLYTSRRNDLFFLPPHTTLEFPGVVGLWTATGVLGGAESCCLCRKLTLVVSYASTVNFPLTRFAKRLTAIDGFPLFFLRRVPWVVATDLHPFPFFFFFFFTLSLIR